MNNIEFYPFTKFRSIVIIISCILSCLNFQSATAAISWQHCYGGSDDDLSMNLIQTRDNGFLVVGMTSSIDGDLANTTVHGFDDVWLLRLDSNLNLVWKKSYGGSGSDIALDAAQTPDGGFIIAGNTDSNDGDVTANHGNGDIWIFKIDSLGNLQWQKSVGGAEYDCPLSVLVNSSNKILVCGGTESSDGDFTVNHGWMDEFVLQMDLSGTINWIKTYGGSDDDVAYEIIENSVNSFMVIGYAFSDDYDVSLNHGAADIWLTKIDNLGNLQWEKVYGGSEDDMTTNVCKLPGGKYFFAANTYSFDGDVTGYHGNGDYWTVVVDSASGQILHEKCFGGTDEDSPWRISKSIDGSIIITGSSLSNDGDVNNNYGDFDGWILHVDTALNPIWSTIVGGSAEDDLYGICANNDGSVLLTGYTYSNDHDVSGNHSINSDIWALKLDSQTGILSTGQSKINLQVYPNPSAGDLFVNTDKDLFEGKVIIRDINGHEVYNNMHSFRKNEVLKIPMTLSSGLYQINIFDNSEIIYSKKIIVAK
ncbi:MAG: T9SS type A sorting domain-containing protein [Bacteroidetes bacterium]|nr:T9SS type A sorting domain-containing protein [Bacteroidota bacterium]